MNLNVSFFELNIVEKNNTTFLGAPAVWYRSASEDGPEIQIAGYLDDEVFLFSVCAEDDEALNEFPPTVDTILASMRRVE